MCKQKHSLTVLYGILTAVIIVLLSASFASAKSNPVIEISSGNTASNEEITIAVSIKDNPGLSGIDLAIDYDQSALELVRIVDAELFRGGVFSGESIDMSSVPHHLTWIVEDVNENNGIIAYLTFKVLKSANTKKYIISIDYDESEMIDYDTNNINFKCIDGVISVQSYFLNIQQVFENLTVNDRIVVVYCNEFEKMIDIKLMYYTGYDNYLFWGNFDETKVRHIKCILLNDTFKCKCNYITVV